ncbi:TRAP transporter substrate-binding protein DctP [Cupriavidus consociatus]|uniref:TRAP transporter substrate-binding protein DctP n=1 Tax=Cupriavidus consociatus TaxID=2821357 RepID=UPI001AE3DFE8|nr:MULTISPECIES: TRAP transporter substrate-binding protein DctP [unclassified Cupriavidus]MBP0620853.1 TRAP transporter substrate-binding protein DctP [Cupriavidus sp. LEh25]MDK2657515.1 TRAP transporter substrate-binding protein DctP [Cupriavidus sp. LEh21]
MNQAQVVRRRAFSSLIHDGRSFLTGLLLLVTVPSCLAQVYQWRAEVPGGLPESEVAAVARLTERFSAQASRALRIAPATASPIPPQQLMEKVKRGDVQLAVIPIDTVATQVRDFTIFDSLFLFKNLDAVAQYERSMDGLHLLSHLGSQGLAGLGYLHGGMLQLVSSKPLPALSNLKGLRLGTRRAGDMAKQWARLSVIPVPLSKEGFPSALREGTVDAAEAPWSELKDMSGGGWVITESNHRYRGYILVVNRAALDALPGLVKQGFLSDARTIIDRHNAGARTGETLARNKAMAGRNPNALSRYDYDQFIGRLKSFVKDSHPDRAQMVARALSVSSLQLAHKYFPDEAPVFALEPLHLAPVAVAATSATRQEQASATPSPSPGPPTTVSYNASLSPLSPASSAYPQRQSLRSRQLATLRFYLGPHNPASILPVQPAAAAIQRSKVDVPLSVVLDCPFCEANADSLKRIVYKPAESRSTQASFSFTPAQAPAGTPYVGTLRILVLNDATGAIQDRMVVDVIIDAEDAVPASVQQSPVTSGGVEPTPEAAWKPDIVLLVTDKQGVSIEIQPMSAEMQALIGKQAFDEHGERRQFSSGIEDKAFLDAVTNSAYGVMSAVSLQGPLVKRLSATGTEAAVSKASQASLRLTDAEATAVTQVIGDIGMQLYRNLFTASNDPGLLTIIRKLEDAADAPRTVPLRLKIVTDGVSLPWQYLHQSGMDPDPKKFWGMRFSLSVSRARSGGPGSAAHQAQELPQKVVFARYGSTADPTVPLAREQMRQLRQIPISDMMEVDSGSALLNQVLPQERKRISAVVAFLHASTGDAQPGDRYSDGPQLKFNEGDLVTSNKLEMLLNRQSEEELRAGIPYLTNAPLVILNACETGPSTQLPHVSLGDVIVRLGAQGVVVTEVAIWITLGHEVATRLIQRLGRGEAVSDALTAIRRELYAEKKNPLGLLYVYYGDPAATLRY